MPGVEDRRKTDLGLCPIEGTLILHSSTTCIILHHYWNFMLVALNFIGMHIYICTYFTAAYCSPPNSPVNGTVHSLTGTKLGSTLRFNCDQGFRLIGQSSASCTRTAQGIYQWNAPVPLCQGEGPITAAGLEVELEGWKMFRKTLIRQFNRVGFHIFLSLSETDMPVTTRFDGGYFTLLMYENFLKLSYISSRFMLLISLGLNSFSMYSHFSKVMKRTIKLCNENKILTVVA